MQAGHIQESVLPGAVRSQAEQDEAQLVKASQQGDQDAFALLVRRHQRRIFNLSMGLLQDEEDASASTQEAFVAAWQRFPRRGRLSNLALSHRLSLMSSAAQATQTGARAALSHTGRAGFGGAKY
jgi:RNA polymerase sigma-70 factor (ECF subfamily)